MKIKLQYDFIVDLATGHSRTSKKWRNRHWQWSELLERCSETQRTSETAAEYDLTEGFCVAGADTAAFLEDALTQLGLTRREANEFIVYWLPRMEGNPYNQISFQQEAYTDSAKLTVTPAPDSILRVFMVWKPLDKPVDIPAQTLPAFERHGFTLVEWGGAKVQ